MSLCASLQNWDGLRWLMHKPRVTFGRIPSSTRRELLDDDGIVTYVGGSSDTVDFHLGNDRRIPKRFVVMEWNSVAKVCGSTVVANLF